MAFAYYVAAAGAEIAGCYAIWMWLRLGKGPIWLVPAVASLMLFAVLLAKAGVGFAGRTYAAYGGVYIAASLVWLWAVEGARPDRWDLAGALLALVGAGLIVLGPRGA